MANTRLNFYIAFTSIDSANDITTKKYKAGVKR